MLWILRHFMVAAAIGILSITPPPANAAEHVLLGVGEFWSYWRGTAEPSADSDSWRLQGFDDSSWGRGQSGFGLGYPWYGEATVILPENGAAFNSVYFRGGFSCDLGTNLCCLTLRVDYDGGFVAYLNGTEVARRNLPGASGTPIPFPHPGSYRTNSGAEEIDLTLFSGLLRPAGNVLAIQWHVPVPVSSSMRFVPELRANFTRGPYLQNVTSTSAHVVWRTAFPTASRLQYRSGDELPTECANPDLALLHDVTLTNLQPGATYFYSVSCAAAGRSASTDWIKFKTLPESGPISFFVTGDVGGGGPAQYALAARMAESQPSLTIFLGDLVYPYYLPGKQDLRFFSVYDDLMRTTPSFSLIGNHEAMYAGMPAYYEDFVLPTNNVPLEAHALGGTTAESYYSFDAGEAHFSCLYVPIQFSSYLLRPKSAQLAWLERDLTQTAKPWKFLLLHHPLRNSGSHRYSDYDFSLTPDSIEVGRLLFPFVERFGVQMVFTAHDHNFERFKPIHGANLIVSGGGGGPLYQMSAFSADPASAVFNSAYHVTKVTVDRDELRLEAIAPFGPAFDTMVYRRVPPPNEEIPIKWGAPSWGQPILAGASPISEGQILPDLGHPLVSSVAGEVSNLGDFNAAYDYSNLYLEFPSVMIYGDATIALFLEGPGLQGVANLAGLGNGLMDPLGEGVDGLDWLQNLEFENFLPSTALLLGDALSQGTLPGLARTNFDGMNSVEYPAPGTPMALGQGAFHLEPHFPALPGAVIQQIAQLPGGGDAARIRAALPVEALGLQEGAVMKLGAVVVRSLGTNTAAGRALWLDRGYLGCKLEGGGYQTSRLTPIRFRLVPSPDPDGDGYPDEIEMKLGTDPLDPRSGFEVNLNALTNGLMRLDWNAVPSRSYLVESSTNLVDSFQPLSSSQGPVRATSIHETLDLPGPDGSPRFYRIRIVR